MWVHDKNRPIEMYIEKEGYDLKCCDEMLR